MEELFPRGKPQHIPSSGPTKKQKQKRAESNDRLFIERKNGSKNDHDTSKLGKKRKIDGIQDETLREFDPSDVRELLEDQSIVQVDFFHQKNAQGGMLLFGCIKEIRELQLIVSLPHCNTGHVQANHISEEYTAQIRTHLSAGGDADDLPSLREMFEVGDFVVCSVIEQGETHNVQLTLDPNVVNKYISINDLFIGKTITGVVKSEEDHGYSINIGNPQVKGFLSNKECGGRKLVIGAVIRMSIINIRGGGSIILLTCDEKKIDKAIVKLSDNVSLDALQPGSIGLFKPSKKFKVGVTGKFLSFHGSVTALDCDLSDIECEEESNNVAVSRKGVKTTKKKTSRRTFDDPKLVKCCVLYVHPLSKHVVLCANKFTLDSGTRNKFIQNQLPDLAYGTKCNAELLSPICGLGAIFQLSSGVKAFCHTKHLSDQKIVDFSTTFGNTTKFNCRINQSVTVDGVVGITLKKSIVESEFYSYENLIPGTLVSCTIQTIKDDGLLVRLGKAGFSPIRGFVPKIHLADVILQHPEKIFAKDDVISCRILSVDKSLGRVRLTHKKTLVKTKLPIVTEYDQLKENLIAHGHIASIKNYGIFINFYNDVHGFVPKSELAVDFIDELEKTFFVGQVVKCRVVNSQPSEERVKLSLILKPKKMNETGHDHQIESVKVLDKFEEGFNVVSCQSNRSGFLPTMHLSDYPSLAKGWYHSITAGDVLDDCVIVKSKGKVIYSKKKSITQFYKNTGSDSDGKCRTFDDLEEGFLSHGFILRHEEYGVFVQLPSGLIGLCPKSKMADKYLLNTPGFYLDNQTVIVKVVEIDREKKRFIVTLKESACDGFPEDQNIETYADEYALLMQSFNPLWVGKMRLGSCFEVLLERKASDGNGYICSNSIFPQDFEAIVLDVSEKKEKLLAALIYVDVSSKQMLLSAKESYISAHKSCKVGSALIGKVKFVNEDIVSVVAESVNQSIVAVAMRRTHPNQTFLDKSQGLRAVGDTLNAVVAHSMCGVTYVTYGGKYKSDTVHRSRFRQASECSDSSLQGEVNFGNLQVGQEVKGIIKSVKNTHFIVRIDESDTDGLHQGQPVTGRLHMSELLNDHQEGAIGMTDYKCWNSITAKVIGFRDVRTHHFLAVTKRNAIRCVVELSRRDISLKLALDTLNVGQKVTAFSSKYSSEKEEMQVEVTPAVKGSIPLLLLSDDPSAALQWTMKCKKPYAWKCTVHEVLRTSAIFAANGSLIDRNTRENVTAIATNCITNGKVVKIFPNRVVLKLIHGMIGVVHVTDSSDDFSDNVFESLCVGKIVRCCVLSCTDRKNLVLSMRKSHLVPESSSANVEDRVISSPKDLTVGMVLRGFIKNISKSGAFVTFSHSVTGRAELLKVSKYYIHDLNAVKDVFAEGKLVTCKVINISSMEGRVEISLLETDTGSPDLVPESLGLPVRHGKKLKDKKTEVGHLVDKVEGRKSKKRKLERERRNKDKLDGDKSDMKKKNSSKKLQKKEEIDSGLDDDLPSPGSPSHSKVLGDGEIEDPGFSWSSSATKDAESIAVTDESSEEEDEEEEIMPPVKKTKREKELEKDREEEDVRKKEEKLLENSLPQTASEFDKLVLASPQNSLIWITYMTFHLQATEIEKARAVAERAIKTIDFREEKERWNIWAALMNLENRFGSEESLSNVIKRACQHNDPFKVNSHMVSIYERSGKWEDAEELCQTMVKKFRQSKTVWMLFITHLMQRGKLESANEVFKRSLQSLDKKTHLEVISKFAQLQYKTGDPEQGRVLFENALSSYPKRADIWFIYIEMLIKSHKLEEVREVLERVITMKFSTKNMKSFFKKFVDFETKYGNENSVVAIKQKALEYIEAKTSNMEELDL